MASSVLPGCISLTGPCSTHMLVAAPSPNDGFLTKNKAVEKRLIQEVQTSSLRISKKAQKEHLERSCEVLHESLMSPVTSRQARGVELPFSHHTSSSISQSQSCLHGLTVKFSGHSILALWAEPCFPDHFDDSYCRALWASLPSRQASSLNLREQTTR